MTYITPANGHVIKNTETGTYVARSGSYHSYTRRLGRGAHFQEPGRG